MKYIPNCFTFLNLIFGFLAILFILQNGLIVYAPGASPAGGLLPGNFVTGCIFIFCAALMDFFDGFSARLFRVTSELGKQLDSLADVVSFGVAPGMIIYQFLIISVDAENARSASNMIELFPAILIPCAGAYRLARFNIDVKKGTGTRGVPIPLAGLLIASFPLIFYYSRGSWATQIILNKWFWYILVLMLGLLMISSLPMKGIKFKDYSVKNNMRRLLLFLIPVILALVIHWMAVPVIFILYLIISIVFKPRY